MADSGARADGQDGGEGERMTLVTENPDVFFLIAIGVSGAAYLMWSNERDLHLDEFKAHYIPPDPPEETE